MVRMQEPPPPFLTVSGLLNNGTDVLCVYGLSRREHDRSRRFEIVENFKCLEERRVSKYIADLILPWIRLHVISSLHSAC